MKRILPLVLAVWSIIALARVQAAESLVLREWKVDGVVREALVYIPPNAKLKATPVVFAFHGHGGSMENAARSFRYQTVWPEAIVVYMQGLKTRGQLTDPEGNRAGWQAGLGDQGDRDLKFFDAVLASLMADFQVDEKRVYATGHSNGGGFTYLLWATRGERLAAVAPSAAIAAKLIDKLKPKPVFHVAGENDPLVKFTWQKRMIEAVCKLNRCGAGKPWGDGCTLYESTVGAPVVTFIHSGTHTFPKEAPARIVRFFKEHAQP